jgi:predicted PurR-regulated permease PerM
MDDKIVNYNVESLLKTGVLFLIIFISFLIFKPFLLVIIWAIIIAVAIYPVFLKVKLLFKGSAKIAASVLTTTLLLVLLVPTVLMAGGLIESLQGLSTQLSEGSLTIPPPTENVTELPVIGEKVASIWTVFSTNLENGIKQFTPEIKNIGEWLLGSVSSLIGAFMMFIFAIIIAGALLMNADKGYGVAKKVFINLVGNQGEQMLINSKLTIGSVVNGVLGTAFIQSSILAIGFFAADVPGASILSLVVLVLAIIQLPTIIVVLPITIYIFPELSGFGSLLFVAWMVLGSISDNFIKPLLLGRGLDIPMLIILIGSIGGMMLMGIVGLFIGAVCLALIYQLFNNWVATE